MAGVKRITLRFYDDNPHHAEILELLDSLPKNDRGIRCVQGVLEPAILAFAKKELRKRRRAKAVPRISNQFQEKHEDQESSNAPSEEDREEQGLFGKVASSINFR